MSYIHIVILSLVPITLFSQNSWFKSNPWRYNEVIEIGKSNEGDVYLLFRDSLCFINSEGDIYETISFNSLPEIYNAHVISQDTFVLQGIGSNAKFYQFLSFDKGSNFDFTEYEDQRKIVFGNHYGWIEEEALDFGDSYRYFFKTIDQEEVFFVETDVQATAFLLTINGIYYTYNNVIFHLNYSGDQLNSKELGFLMHQVIETEELLSIVGRNDDIVLIDPISLEIVKTINAKMKFDGFFTENFRHLYFDDRIYVSSRNELDYSDDEGQTWIDIGRNEELYERSSTLLLPLESNILIQSALGLELIDQQSLQIKSVNRYPWSRIIDYVEIKQEEVFILTSFRTNGYLKLWKSQDFGVSWYPISSWKIPNSFVSTYFDLNSKGVGLYHNKSSDSLYFTVDFGMNWNAMFFQEEVHEIDITEDDLISILTNNFIYQKKFDDLNWKKIEHSLNITLAVFSKDYSNGTWFINIDENNSKLDLVHCHENFVSPAQVVNSEDFLNVISNTDPAGNLYVSTDMEVVSFSVNDIVKKDFDNSTGLIIIDVNSNDSFFVIRNDSLLITNDLLQESKYIPWTFDDSFYPIASYNNFNSFGEGLFIDFIGQIDVYNESSKIVTNDEESNYWTPNKSIHLFPNPANQIIQIETGVEFRHAHVYNHIGQIQGSFSNGKYDVNELTKGIYWVILFDKNFSPIGQANFVKN